MLAVALILMLMPRPDTVRAPGITERLGLGLAVGGGFDLPFTRADPSIFGPGPAGPVGTNAAARLMVNAHAFHRLRASVTYFRYLVPRLQAPWDPDFVYSVSYDVGWLRGASISYANYDANRLSPREGQRFTRLDRGMLAITYSAPLPESLGPLTRLDPSARVQPRISYDVAPSYWDAAAAGYQGGKHRVGAGARFQALGGYFLDAMIYAYPDPERQQPWDPDFTYVFGYSVGYPATLTLQYANYSGNRLPGRERATGTGTFGNGTVSVAWVRRF